MATVTFKRTSQEGVNITPETEKSSVSWHALVEDGVNKHPTVRDAPNFPVQQNDPHPDDPGGRMRCNNVVINRVNAGRLWVVEASFEIPPSGGSKHVETESGNPLQLPLVFEWSDIEITEEVDRDADNRAILNSSGEPFDQNVSRRFKSRELTIIGNRSSFDINYAQRYELRLNKDPFLGALPGGVLCSSIRPTGSYAEDPAFVETAHTFEFRSEDVFGKNPHDHKLLDRGFSAIFRIDGEEVRERLVSKVSGEYPVSPPLFGGFGVPIQQSRWTHLDENGLPEASPTYVRQTNNETLASFQDANSRAVFLQFAKYERVAFSGMRFRG